MNANRRVRAYTMSVHWFEQLRTSTEWEVIEGLPADAKVLAVHDDHLRRSIVVIAEHPSFDEVPSGEVVPLFTVTLKRHYREPYAGMDAICRACNKPIVYVGPYWSHVGPVQPRHIAAPKE